MKKTTAIIPGSFDPVTLGHLALFEKAAEMFENVTVLLCHNFDKKTLFSFEQRLELLRASVSHLENVTVDSHTGWLYEYLLDKKEVVLFKGVRNTVDFEYEKNMAEFNFEHSGVDTVFLLSEEKFAEISSTKVRKLLSEGGDWKKIIPQNAQKLIENFYENI
ncbi:MAG: pantetheine-phosphate adenylyltransferase [Ruminococcaceae bacterium]|nr:pantetheine-phosphate adenylyltransferase [Oscillospiraceae bacterium]